LPDASIGNNSLYFLIQRTFFSKIRLQTGLRYDNRSLKTIALGLPAQPDYRPSISKNYNSLSGSLGATYQATDKLFFRSNLAAAYRTPNLAELTSKGQHESRYEIGNPDLAPEKSFEADASLHYHADNLTIDAAGFYNTIQDYIFISSTTDTTEDGLPVYLYGQNHAGLFGFEAGIHVHPAHLKWLHLLTTFSAVNGRQKDGEYLPFIPAHKIFLEIRVEKEQLAFLHHIYLTLSTTMVLDQKRVASEETPTNGYALFDLLLGGRIPVKEQMLTLGFGITNLFDATYRDHMSTLRDVGYCDPGRNFTVMLKVPFTVRKP
jgi:iron complex outermembrane receptor protein